MGCVEKARLSTLTPRLRGGMILLVSVVFVHLPPTYVLDRGWRRTWSDVFYNGGSLFGAVGTEPVGIARIKEALEANDWAGGAGDDFQSDDLRSDSDEEADGRDGFGAEAAELEREMFGMRNAIYGDGQLLRDEGDEEDKELKVDQLESLMVKMQVVKGNHCHHSWRI